MPKSREELRQWWVALPDSEKLFIPICFLNCLVFAAWRIPALQVAAVGDACSCVHVAIFSYLRRVSGLCSLAHSSPSVTSVGKVGKKLWFF